MKVSIHIGHPAHVHLFRNLIVQMRSIGHRVQVTVRKKDITLELLDGYGINYSIVGHFFPTIMGKAIGTLLTDYELIRKVSHFQPDVTINMGQPYSAQTSRILRIPNITMNDTENATLVMKNTTPFTSLILTPSCYTVDHGAKQLRYESYHELAYLHPNWFEPDESVLEEMGLQKGEKFVIVRFVSWASAHDIHHQGMDEKIKIEAVKEFSKYAKVFITSEAGLPKELKPYAFPIPPHRIHHAMYYATMLFGESSTMASECAVLGTPAIFLDNVGRGYTTEQEEKYGAVFNFTESIEDQKKAVAKGIEILQTENVKEIWAEKRDQILKDKIDLTNFLIWFLENYPSSEQQMRNDPQIQFEKKKILGTENKMKICLVGARAYPTDIGGIGVHMQNIAPRLAAKGHDVTVIVGKKNNKSYELMDGVKVRRLRYLDSRYTTKVTMAPNVVYFAKKDGNEVVHAHDAVMGFSSSIFFYGRNVVFTVHGFGHIREDWPTPIRWILKFFETSAFRLANKVIAVDNNTRKSMMKRRKEIELIGNGIDPKVFENLPCPEEFGDKINIIYVSRLIPTKCPELLLEAYKRLPAEAKEKSHLYIIGDGHMRDELKEMVKKEEGVTFCGYVKDVKPYFSNSDIFVLPSLYEALPISLLEALASNNACIATGISDFADRFEDGKHLIVTDPNNVMQITKALDLLINDDDKRKELASNALELMKTDEYNWDCIVDKLEAVYEEILNT